MIGPACLYLWDVAEPEKQDHERPFLAGIRRLVLALSIPLVGAALLWWLPGSITQTRWVSLGVIVLALAGWWFWRED